MSGCPLVACNCKSKQETSGTHTQPEPTIAVQHKSHCACPTCCNLIHSSHCILSDSLFSLPFVANDSLFSLPFVRQLVALLIVRTCLIGVAYIAVEPGPMNRESETPDAAQIHGSFTNTLMELAPSPAPKFYLSCFPPRQDLSRCRGRSTARSYADGVKPRLRRACTATRLRRHGFLCRLGDTSLATRPRRHGFSDTVTDTDSFGDTASATQLR
jgi:hypothetical protein